MGNDVVVIDYMISIPINRTELCTEQYVYQAIGSWVIIEDPGVCVGGPCPEFF